MGKQTSPDFRLAADVRLETKSGKRKAAVGKMHIKGRDVTPYRRNLALSFFDF